MWYNRNMFNAAIQLLMRKEQRMRLGGYDVEVFDRDKATVAGTKITRGELEELVSAMKSLPDFRIDNMSDPKATLYKEFVNFRMSAPPDGWLSTSPHGYHASQADFALPTPSPHTPS